MNRTFFHTGSITRNSSLLSRKTAPSRFSNRYFSTSHENKDATLILEKVQDSPKEFVKLASIDLDGIPRGKYISKEKFLSAAKKGSAFCSVVFGWDMNDSLYDNTKVTGWHMGYSDFPTTIDLKTYRKVPYEEDTPFFIMDFNDPKDPSKPLPICPRNLLKQVLGSIEESHRLKAMVGCEYEFFTFRETTHSLKEKKYVDPEPLTPGMFGYSLQRMGLNREFFHSIMTELKKFGVPLEGFHTETGPGVLEAAIQFSDALESADRAVLFKMAVKDLGRNYGIMPSFMAKPNASLPGCGGHMHVSLHNLSDGKNIFYDEKSKDGMSEQFKHFIAGQLYCMPEILPMFAPTVNSYKRMVEGYWAPTTPTWGIENRTVSLRVIAGGKATRVEVRTPGADVNPYLGVAASLASGMYGIKNKLPLKAGVEGNAYGKKEEVNPRDRLPRNLGEAASRMGDSKLARELFGDVFVDHFVATRVWEWRQFQAAVTDWEKQRYFEIL